MTEKPGLLLLPALLAACQGHFQAGSGGPELVNARLVPANGLVAARSWCDKSRGIPLSPDVGISRPIVIGIGSIVYESDGTTESFAAADALRRGRLIPERKTEVVLVDHPTDADYSVSGVIQGAAHYYRAAEMNPVIPAVGYGLGYIGGGTVTLTGVIIGLASDTDTGTLTALGLLGLSLGVGSSFYVWSRPANHYSWNHSATLVLRRHGVPIGQFVVADSGNRTSWSAYPGLRNGSLRRLWRKAAGAISRCIQDDLGG